MKCCALLQKNYDSFLAELSRLPCPAPDLAHLTSIYVEEYQKALQAKSGNAAAADAPASSR